MNDIERLKTLALAVETIAHTKNHCGVEYTHLSEIAEQVIDEVLPEVELILGRKVATVTRQTKVGFNPMQGEQAINLIRRIMVYGHIDLRACPDVQAGLVEYLRSYK